MHLSGQLFTISVQPFTHILYQAQFFLGDNKTKADTLKKLILMIMNGEKIGQGLMMQVIRFCLPTSDHTIKKLLLLFFEIVPKVCFVFVDKISK